MKVIQGGWHFLKRIRRRLLGNKPEPVPVQPAPLQMVWPLTVSAAEIALTVPAGYVLQVYQPGDEFEFFTLMERTGFKGWTTEIFQDWLQKILPDGFYFIRHQATGKMAATAMGCHNPTPLHPFGASLSCVGADPDYQGLGLGHVVSLAVTRRLVAAGYKAIYLETQDWRLPAVKTYLKIGWVPFLYQPDMPERWQAVCAQLKWPYQPEAWPALSGPSAVGAGGHA
jgi:mycothiol synthase